jgi:hypothetical protein
MVKRVSDIHIEKSDDYKYEIWCDLAAKDIEGLEGVVYVSAAFKDVSGSILVVIDPRYDVNSVLEEIRELDEFNRTREISVKRGFTG